jgi:C4-dicarboxylate-specific signal transduction histidine kinase
MPDTKLPRQPGGLFLFILVLPILIGIGVSLVSDALGPPSSIFERRLLLIGMAVVVWVSAVLWVFRHLTRSIAFLEAAAQRVAAGNYSPLEHQPMATPHLETLRTAFELMIQRLQEAREALDLQMSEERAMREELQLLQRQVIRQERLAAVGLLVSGVAHEINNPLQAILGFAELLQLQHNLPEAVNSDLRLIQRESARACGIIRNLALFARQQPGQAAAVRLSDVITSVAELRQRRLESEDIELLIDNQSTRPVMAVFTELQQVLLNFVVNAEQVILASGRLPGRITIRARDERRRVVLEVEDTGTGVSPEDEAKLFQPFFTTKPVGEGTGLGLSVSYGIVDSMGGKMGYRRAPAGGAIFWFELPAAPAA